MIDSKFKVGDTVYFLDFNNKIRSAKVSSIIEVQGSGYHEAKEGISYQVSIWVRKESELFNSPEEVVDWLLDEFKAHKAEEAKALAQAQAQAQNV